MLVHQNFEESKRSVVEGKIAFLSFIFSPLEGAQQSFFARSVKSVWSIGVEVVPIDYATLTHYNLGTTGAGKNLEVGGKGEKQNFASNSALFNAKREYGILDPGPD